MRILVAATALIALGGVALAQHHQHHPAPYAGMQHRAVKGLSDQQLDDLRAGRGMGFALAAELNGYPGPIHVLEMADQLRLSGDQRLRMRELTDQMKGEAISVGERLIAWEQGLEHEFARQLITPTTLAELTSKIGETQGELRAVHLKYHLATAELLTSEQKERYAALRGYR
jgi:hypothetical protein